MRMEHPKDICKECGHFREDHELSTGGECYKTIKRKVRGRTAIFKCDCGSFKE